MQVRDMIRSLNCLTRAHMIVYLLVSEGLSTLTANEHLVLAGTLHGVHAITSKLSPTGRGSGVQVIEGEDFKLNVMLTLTGTYESTSRDIYYQR